MRVRKDASERAMRAAVKLHKYIERGDCSPTCVGALWHESFSTAATYLGFDRRSRGLLWEELVVGNWSRLHLTEDERGEPPEHWLQELSWDAYYCADRWSLDRLARCHWLYRQYKWALWRKERGL